MHSLALNFKNANYRTQWVELPDVTSTRKSLGIGACRHWADGSEYYTLPVLKNSKTGEVIGDSFDIALYLDKLYPDGPTLVAPMTRGLLKAFNAQVDYIFTNHVLLMAAGMPFNPAVEEESKKIFVDRACATSFDFFVVKGEAREKLLASFEKALEELARAYQQSEGPFLEGHRPTYADLIVGGWIVSFACRGKLFSSLASNSVRRCLMPGILTVGTQGMTKECCAEWKVIAGWHDSLLGKLHEALAQHWTIR